MQRKKFQKGYFFYNYHLTFIKAFKIHYYLPNERTLFHNLFYFSRHCTTLLFVSQNNELISRDYLKTK